MILIQDKFYSFKIYYKLDVLNVAHNIFIISNHFKLFRIFERLKFND